jgi:DNA-directed RNA polymerase sigma subunit (sigma70/sigma32)
LKSLLDSLDKREANVLNHRYGLLGESEKTLVKTGRVMGISGERVRVLEARALRKCRAVCRKELVSKLTHKKLYKDITGNDLQ